MPTGINGLIVVGISNMFSFPFNSNGIWMCWQFSICSGTKQNSVCFRIKWKLTVYDCVPFNLNENGYLFLFVSPLRTPFKWWEFSLTLARGSPHLQIQHQDGSRLPLTLCLYFLFIFYLAQCNQPIFLPFLPWLPWHFYLVVIEHQQEFFQV